MCTSHNSCFLHSHSGMSSRGPPATVVRDATILANRLVRDQKKATTKFEKRLAQGLAQLRREKDRAIAKLHKKKKTVAKLRDKIIRVKAAAPKKAASEKMSIEKAYAIVFGGATTKVERTVAQEALKKWRQVRTATKYKHTRIPVFAEDLDRVKSQVAEINGDAASED